MDLMLSLSKNAGNYNAHVIPGYLTRRFAFEVSEPEMLSRVSRI